ncbi:putative glutamyl-tRNA(Gln) amidotransferase subunit A [Novosphingobium nitrogenifigens DSM 19370]|uniref:Putative glutamyl-tRNA(Gln) amidotransferase subunit A n=1 Tax=Novosphingobium nitrogenifigens DSM 19370 TaxID=983920 RepID=F1Z6H9_9SPHN|nr:AtzE family amidohydrolase [Novosphingobium nitrogenifigens]EGD59639.1 putative glutamyl-tRNA(Gln) amidotransferase subunit A [Novosphingobium nitrogenifigens DSM 19370]
MTLPLDALAIAASVRQGQCSATEIARAALARIRAKPDLLAVTRILEDRALAEAALVDAQVARGEDPGPLAGVPYGVKDLFDVAGLPTTAGAARLEFAEPAAHDAIAIERLRAAGAVLCATLNMDEFAYGFVTDNARWGITRNPHDPDRFAGGSSGGSAAAVAGGLLSFTLGSDTNGSIRIPASLCGLFGIKPTHDSLPMEGTFPFVHTLDDIGAFARSASDLALIDSVLRGEPAANDAGPLRVALLGGWFARDLVPDLRAALDTLASAIGPLPTVEPEGVAAARSAAFVLSAWEGGRLHAPSLASDALSYDPATRDRLIAGAALPEDVHAEALARREVFAHTFDTIFARYDVLIAPTVVGPAPLIAHPVVTIDGEEKPARANLGLFTQPISFLGLPVIAAPLAVPGLPLGIQLIGAKGSDARLIAFARDLEAKGLLATKLRD